MKYILRFLGFLIKLIFIVVLPFIILIRGSVFFNTNMEWAVWPSLMAGILITGFILFIYMSFIYGRITGKIGDKKNLKRRLIFSLLVVLGFTLHSLVFLSNKNIKSEEIKEEYTQLHPLLRLGVSTIVLIDKGLIVTDAKRVPEDYQKMGLPKKGQSLHYKQEDGFSYAIDLRTNDRSEFRNQALAVYFGAMGFNVLRHVGTADHLHISMKCKFLPGAK